MEAQHALFDVPVDVERQDRTVAGKPACRIRTPGVREDRAVLYLPAVVTCWGPSTPAMS